MNIYKQHLTIRDSKESDIVEILRIQKDAFLIYAEWVSKEQIPPLSETTDDVIKDFNEKTILIAESEKQILGSIRFSIKAGVCFFEKLSVDTKLQRTGIGTALVNEVEKRANSKAHKVYLETGLLAANLIHFYTKLGYSGEAILKKHYGAFDWVIFSKFFHKAHT